MSNIGHEVDAFNTMLRDGLSDLRGPQLPDQSTAETFRNTLRVDHAALLGQVLRFCYGYARTFYNGQPFEYDTPGIDEGTVLEAVGAGLQKTGRLNSYGIIEISEYLSRRQTFVKISEPSVFINIRDEYGKPELPGLELAVPIIHLGHVALKNTAQYE